MDDDDELIRVFKYALRRLDVNEAGLTDNNDLADLNALAALCLAVDSIAAGENTLQELCLRRLVSLTGDLLVGPWAAARTTVADWLIARSELLQVEIPGA